MVGPLETVYRESTDSSVAKVGKYTICHCVCSFLIVGLCHYMIAFNATAPFAIIFGNDQLLELGNGRIRSSTRHVLINIKITFPYNCYWRKTGKSIAGMP